MSHTRIAQTATQFSRDSRGNIAMMTGLVLLPIVAIMGFAVDISITGHAREEAAKALDAAVLAAARAKVQGLSDSEIEEQFEAYFEAMTAQSLGGLSCSAPALTEDGLNMSATTDCTTSTLISGATGRKKIGFNLDSTATYGVGKLDIAMVFDVSGSMNWDSASDEPDPPSRLEALQDAAKSAVDHLLRYNTDDTDDVRIALVGYSSSVHAGDYFEYATGLSPTRTYTHGSGGDGDLGVQTAGTFSSHVFIGLYDARTDSLIAEIGDGSVIRISEDEEGDLNVGVTIRSGSPFYGQVGSMYLDLNDGDDTRTENVTPYALYGDSGGNYSSGDLPMNRWNNLEITGYSERNRNGTEHGTLDFDFYIEVAEETSEQTITNYCTFERDSEDWDKATAPRSGHYISAKHAWYDEDDEEWDTPSDCTQAEPFALTTDAQALKDYIDDLYASGGTAGHMGIQWGRFLLSPDWSDAFVEGSKPLAWDEPDSQKILIMMTDGEFNSTYHDDLGNSFDQARAHCDDAKNEDHVLIYTIAFNAPQAGQDILNYCASGPDFRFDANNGQELLDAYTAIAASISDLRLVSNPENSANNASRDSS